MPLFKPWVITVPGAAVVMDELARAGSTPEWHIIGEHTWREYFGEYYFPRVQST
jgi:hypothetical protein